MSQRHVPQRTCMGCGKRDAQPLLMRVAIDADGELSVVLGGAVNGRSGYMHREKTCWAIFVARKGKLRSLGRAVEKSARSAFFEQVGRDVDSFLR